MPELDPWDPRTDKWEYIRDSHITDWPPECLEVMALYSSLCRPDEIALMMNLPIERVSAWFDFARTRIFGFPPEGIPAQDAIATTDDWVWTHRACCSRQICEEVRTKHYVLAELHGLDQPRARQEQLFEDILKARDREPPNDADTPGPSRRRSRGRGRHRS